jgi:hypothetical protein
MPRTGRPREPDAMHYMLRVRARTEQGEAWRLAADAEDTSVSDVARELLDAWAERVLTDKQARRVER